MDFPIIVGQCLNLSITIHGLFRPRRRVLVTFWQHFVRVIAHKPVAALAALYWHLTRRKVRARNRLRIASADLPFAYSVWIANNERMDDLERECDAIVRTWTRVPRFSVIIQSDNPSEWEAGRSLTSVESQVYANWTVVGSGTNPISSTIAAADGDFVLLLRAGDLLAPSALFRLAEALQVTPEAEILYGDEDQIDARGRRSRPWFKPRWNEELFLAQDYLGPAVAVETNLARRAAATAGANRSAFLLAATSQTKNVVHVPHILVHVAANTERQDARMAAVAEHVESFGARCAPGPFGTVKVEWPLPSELPRVSIIVPTRDGLDLLQPCVKSLLERTSYDNFEVVIVDNESVEPRTLQYFDEITRDPRVRLISFPGPYNFSSMNNFAIREVSGPYVCLLNNDTEVVESAWLTEMMRYAVRPEVGAVGAKLIYDDGSIQHAGVVIGLGEAAGHAHRFLPPGDPGYFRQPHVTQFMSAVTAACLVIDKKKFLAAGGLDEGLAVAFNDVDLCLKLQDAGFRNVYVPHAVLVHHESKTRGSDMARAQFARYLRELHVLQERWGTKTYCDPLHNPNLDRYTETFVIGL
jgi:GT2 family glycosyltransferase